MSGAQHFCDIFNVYSEYKIEETKGGTPICVFRKPGGVPTIYAGGNGFVMTGGASALTHTFESLERMIAIGEGLYDIPPPGLQTWKEARDALASAISAKNPAAQKLAV